MEGREGGSWREGGSEGIGVETESPACIRCRMTIDFPCRLRAVNQESPGGRIRAMNLFANHLPCRRRWRRFGCVAIAVLAAISGTMRAADKAESPGEGSGILLVSKVSSPKVYAPVEGARQTVLAPAYADKYGVRLYSKEKWQADGLAWDGFYRAAVKRADELVDSLELQFKRDPRGVLDYALVESESPWLSSVLLSRRFLPRFEREFGERLHVVVVGRHRLYVFPADGGKLEIYSPALADLYHDDSLVRHPVSLEVFLVEKGGFRVIGSIED